MGRSSSHLSTWAPSCFLRKDILVSSFNLEVLVLRRTCSNSSTLASTWSMETSLLPEMMALEADFLRQLSLFSISDIAFASRATLAQCELLVGLMTFILYLMAHFLHSLRRTWASSSSVETDMSSSLETPDLYWYWMWWPANEREFL